MLTKDFVFMGRHKYGLFHHCEVWYSPVRVESWALVNRGKIKYFTELQVMLDFAVKAKLIHPEALPSIRINLAQEAADLDSKSFSERWEIPETPIKSFRETR